jgi:hypothetical protein
MICEGPDGAGKSTLLAKLSRDLGVQVKEWPEARNDMAAVGVFRRVFDTLAGEVRCGNDNRPYLHDRLFFSELVYGRVLRGRIAFNPKQVQLIGDILRALEIPIIFCRPPLEVVQRNITSSAGIQMADVPEHIEAIWDRYCRYPAMFRPYSRVYDYTGQTQPTTEYEQIVELCEKYLKKRDARTWQSSDGMSSSASAAQ